MAINKVSSTTKSAIIRKSVKSLPNKPSDKGYKAEEIKKAMYEPITGEQNSVIAEIDRVVDEVNEEFAKQENKQSTHTLNKENPHSVTKSQVGLGNVDNTSDENKPLSSAARTALESKVAKEDMYDGLDSDSVSKVLTAHQGKVLKLLIDSLSLLLNGKADESSVANRLINKLDSSLKGVSLGVAELDASGKVPVSQLPMQALEVMVNLIDMVSTAPTTFENGDYYYNTSTKLVYEAINGAWQNGTTPSETKIYYVTSGTNAGKQYRWSGTELVVAGSNLSLGETSNNAFRGDHGKVAYQHTFDYDNPHKVTKNQIGLDKVENTADAEKKVASAKQLETARNINGVLFNGTEDITVYDNTKVPIPSGVTGKTATKVTYDNYGRVLSGEELSESDIPAEIPRQNAIDNIDNRIEQINANINKKLDKNVGAANSGKIMKVNAAGEIIPEDAPEGTTVINDLNQTETANWATSAASAHAVKEIKSEVEGLGEKVVTKEVELGLIQMYQETDATTGEVSLVFEFPDE